MIGTGSGLKLGLDRYLYILATMVLDGCLGGLHRGLEERIGIAWKQQHHLNLPRLAWILRCCNGRRIGQHITFY